MRMLKISFLLVIFLTFLNLYKSTAFRFIEPVNDEDNKLELYPFKLWTDHKEKYGLKFDHISEEERRLNIFKENIKFINEHNEKKLSFTLKSNQFTHLTREEYLKYVKNPNNVREKNLIRMKQIQDEEEESYNYKDVDPIDWRSKNIVSPVKDQKYCGSCWAFATTGAIESALAKANGEIVLLSEQQLVDCGEEFFNYGCNGGYNDFAMGYVVKYGLETEKDYPYEAQDRECRYSKEFDRYYIKNFEKMPTGEKYLDKTLQEVGPAAISIDASLDTFRFYNSGIYYDPGCSSDDLDHAVLAVGLDYDKNGNSFYIIKNSWGETWGDKGYIKMLRDGTNHCGVATEAVYAIVNETQD